MKLSLLYIFVIVTTVGSFRQVHNMVYDHWKIKYTPSIVQTRPLKTLQALSGASSPAFIIGKQPLYGTVAVRKHNLESFMRRHLPDILSIGDDVPAYFAIAALFSVLGYVFYVRDKIMKLLGLTPPPPKIRYACGTCGYIVVLPDGIGVASSELGDPYFHCQKCLGPGKDFYNVDDLKDPRAKKLADQINLEKQKEHERLFGKSKPKK